MWIEVGNLTGPPWDAFRARLAEWLEKVEATLRRKTLVDPVVDGSLVLTPGAGVLPSQDPNTVGAEPVGSLNDWREVDLYVNPWVEGAAHNERYMYRFSANAFSKNFRVEFMNYTTATYGSFRIQLRGPADIGPRDIRLVPLNGGQVLAGSPAAPVATRVAVPASVSAAGASGQWAATADHLYVYTGNGTAHAWRRAALEPW